MSLLYHNDTIIKKEKKLTVYKFYKLDLLYITATQFQLVSHISGKILVCCLPADIRIVYRCLKSCKLCLCLLEVLSLNRDCQVSLENAVFSHRHNLYGFLNGFRCLIQRLTRFLIMKARRELHPAGCVSDLAVRYI